MSAPRKKRQKLPAGPARITFDVVPGSAAVLNLGEGSLREKLAWRVPLLPLPRTVERRDGEPESDWNRRKATLANRLVALWFHWEETRNPLFALSAIVESLRQGVSPPAWPLLALKNGFEKHTASPKGNAGAQLGLTARGSGAAHPGDEYQRRHQLSEAMIALHRLHAGLGIAIADAARRVRKRLQLTERSGTLADYYRKQWRPFYERVVDRVILDPEEQASLQGEFPPVDLAD